MEPRGPDPPARRAERPGQRQRRAQRERSQARARARPRRAPGPPVVPPPPRPLITQGRLSRAPRGLLASEVKSLDVARLLGGPAEGAGDKENEAPGGPPSPRSLLAELRAELPLPGAFPGRSLVQEARAQIIGAVLARHGELPDLGRALRGPREQGAGPEPRSPEDWRTVPLGQDHPDPEAIVESRRMRRRKGKRELVFTLGATPSPPSTEKSLVLPPDPWVPSPSPPPPPLGPERGEMTWGPQTSFDVLKSIWLPATPPTCAPPWQWGAGVAPHPPACFPNSEALDWSPSPPAPMPGLPWFVSRSSPEPWTFPRMRLY